MAVTCEILIKLILAVLLPPFAVLWERGCSADFLINILLTILGYIPGMIHAVYIVLHYNKDKNQDRLNYRYPEDGWKSPSNL